MVYEAGVDISDIYEARVESLEAVQEKRMVLRLGMEKLMAIAWKSIAGSSTGSVSKQQIQRSKNL